MDRMSVPLSRHGPRQSPTALPASVSPQGGIRRHQGNAAAWARDGPTKFGDEVRTGAEHGREGITPWRIEKCPKSYTSRKFGRQSAGHPGRHPTRCRRRRPGRNEPGWLWSYSRRWSAAPSVRSCTSAGYSQSGQLAMRMVVCGFAERKSTCWPGSTSTADPGHRDPGTRPPGSG